MGTGPRRRRLPLVSRWHGSHRSHNRHPQRAQQARDKVLRRLAEFQVWPQAAVDEALEEPLLLAPRLEPSLAPLLARRLNRPDSPPLIRTTLDATLQRRLEDLLLGWRARLPEHTSAAILVVEEESMAVRAYLGSVDINDAKRFGHVDMISAASSCCACATTQRYLV